ncbi:MAG: hypothetical protein L6R37_000368 [Teloschistes peruensis]|nr:MAG: hypothetical protein L6R37_000368 [Teloschistes peruensis]
MTTALKSIKSLSPLLDRILVQRIKAEAKTAGGIFLPESSVKELNEAKVLAVGPGGLDKEGKRVTPSVAPGDKVLIPQPGEGWGGGVLAVPGPRVTSPFLPQRNRGQCVLTKQQAVGKDQRVNMRQSEILRDLYHMYPPPF